jgi:hypothetical protein
MTVDGTPMSARFDLQFGLAALAMLFALARADAADIVGADANHPATLAVQINQVALERVGPKIAIVEYAGPARAGEYRVLRDGAVVKRAALDALAPFSEWGEKRYFSADFSELVGDGRYRVEAELGGEHATSPEVIVARHALFATTARSVLHYFHANRYLDEADRHIRIFGTQRYVDVYGGWQDAGGDPGKYLSHLSFANFFSPQQAAMATWVLAKTYDLAPALYREAGLDGAALSEALWGADFLHRLLDPEGYFYETVFDRWGTPGAERVVTGFEGLDGNYSEHYRAAFREGGGLAIAALARVAILAGKSGSHGEFTERDYLADAERAFEHLERNNPRYDYDGIENVIDDYAALMAAVELHHATGKAAYLEAARIRAEHLSARQTPEGWFVSDRGSRPYYHGVEAGFPVLALVYYVEIEHDGARRARARATIDRALRFQLALDRRVANPYNYARQAFRTYGDGQLSTELKEGFFMPHRNETGYWWQGESARLASLSTAAILGGRLVRPDPHGPFGVDRELAAFAQNQLDWTLGRNPFRMCMLAGFGVRNPEWAESSGDITVGGIANGITGADGDDDGRGIVWAPGPDENNWRWLEQWLPHATWFLLATVTLATSED